MENYKQSSVSIGLAIFLALGLLGPIRAQAVSPASVNLGSAGNFVILAKTGISTTGTTAVTGNLGLSPAAASYITGFALSLPSASPFSTSAKVTGQIFASDYTSPTPSNLTTAVLDMQNAYTDAMGRAPGVTELGAGNVGGLTLVSGVYKWGTGLTIPTDVTLSGGANDVWIFQIAQNLNVSSGVKVVLAGGASANNVYWVVAGQTIIGTTAIFNGNILDQTAIVLNTGATLNGRALAQTAVTLDSNAVTISTGSAPATPAVPATPAIPATPAVSTTTPAVPATPATPAVPATSATSTVQVVSTTSDYSSLNSHQQQKYDQLVAVGVNQTIALNAVKQISASMTTAIASEPVVSEPLAPASAFGQQVRMIAKSLGQGSKDSNVATLQQFLISQNKGSASRDLADVGATSYFGLLTRKALAEFQASVGISPAVGNFGSITREYLNSHY